MQEDTQNESEKVFDGRTLSLEVDEYYSYQC